MVEGQMIVKSHVFQFMFDVPYK